MSQRLSCRVTRINNSHASCIFKRCWGRGVSRQGSSLGLYKPRPGARIPEDLSLLACVTLPPLFVQLARSRSVCQSAFWVRGHARCVWNLWAGGRRAWLSHRCSTWLIDAGPFQVFSGRMSSIHEPVHPPRSRPHLSLLSLSLLTAETLHCFEPTVLWKWSGQTAVT